MSAWGKARFVQPMVASASEATGLRCMQRPAYATHGGRGSALPAICAHGLLTAVARAPFFPPPRLQVIATAPPQRTRAVHIVPHHQAQVGQARAADESSTDGQLRRVRQRRE